MNTVSSNTLVADKVTIGGKVICTDPAHVYLLTGNQPLKFIKRKGGELIHEGTTNEELLTVLIDRTKNLNAQFPCRENEFAIQKMEEALLWFNERTNKRIKQGVETKDIAHQDTIAGQ